MGPKKVDNTNRGRRPSQGAIGTTDEHENQQCVGKFSVDLEFCCRDPTSPYPVNIPVYIRGHPPLTSQIPFTLQPTATNSGPSAAPSVSGGVIDEQAVPSVKHSSHGRAPSITQSGNLTGIDNDNKSSSFQGYEPSKSALPCYKTFHVLRDSECFRPKLLVDTVGNENESIDQITALYMRGWLLDQRFLNILKRIVPLQEQLHTLNLCFVGLNEQTLLGLVDVSQSIKNLKTLLLDGNPLGADYFHLFISKDELKLANLSLRFCKITDANIERFAYALGNMSNQNKKLLTLTLTGNQITDNGAMAFAKALRYNRTLISLNLSSNFITDRGARALALVLRKFVLTEEEIIHRRYLLNERCHDTHFEDLRNSALSPTLSTISTKSKSGVREIRTEQKRPPDPTKRSKSIAVKATDKRHRNESGDELRPPSGSKTDAKKGKGESSAARSSSLATRRPPADQAKTSTNSRGKKLATGTSNLSRNKSISIVKEEDEDAIDEEPLSLLLPPGKLNLSQVQYIERENPLLEQIETDSHTGEISLKGNLVLLNLNLSRNHLTTFSVSEFLASVQYQSMITNFNPTKLTAVSDFSALCRLELKGMAGVSLKSQVYQTLETILAEKNPLIRCQHIREREAKELIEQQQLQLQQQQQQQQQQQAAQAAQQAVPEKTRTTSNAKSSNQRPMSRLKD